MRPVKKPWTRPGRRVRTDGDGRGRARQPPVVPSRRDSGEAREGGTVGGQWVSSGWNGGAGEVLGL
ncbi:MAG: hypothetical protein ACTSU5_02905 [Promethearchaeota archaeon]